MRANHSQCVWFVSANRAFAWKDMNGSRIRLRISTSRSKDLAYSANCRLDIILVREGALELESESFAEIVNADLRVHYRSSRTHLPN